MNLRELVRETAQRLRRAPLHYGHGTSNAGDEAAFLVLRGLGLPFEAPADRRVSPGEVQRIGEMNPLNNLRGTFDVEGVATNNEVSFTHSPENPPLIQEFRAREISR